MHASFSGDEEDPVLTEAGANQHSTQCNARLGLVAIGLAVLASFMSAVSSESWLPENPLETNVKRWVKLSGQQNQNLDASSTSSEKYLNTISTATTTSPRVLNVHVVPHTHDDVGWLKTVEQYYFGWNDTIQEASVESILDSVVSSLLENEDRTFTYVESKFFSMWWARQNDAVRDSVRFLIANGQLSFVNGGWCMHGENSNHLTFCVE